MAVDSRTLQLIIKATNDQAKQAIREVLAESDRMHQGAREQAKATESAAGGVADGIKRIFETAVGVWLGQKIPQAFAALKQGFSENYTLIADYERQVLSLQTMVAQQKVQASEVTKTVGYQQVLVGGLTLKQQETMAGLKQKIQEDDLGYRQAVAALDKAQAATTKKRGKETITVGPDPLKVEAAQLAVQKHQATLEKDAAAFSQLSGQTAHYATVAKTATEYTLDMQTALAMSRKETEQLVAWAVKLGVESPFESKNVLNALQNAMTMGFTTEEAKRLTQDLVDFAAATGRSDDAMARMAYSLGQAKTSGKLMGEELRELQLAGLPVSSILAKAFNMSVEQMDAARQKGELNATQAIEAIEKSIEQWYGGAAKSMANSLAGIGSSMKDVATEVRRNFWAPVFNIAQPYMANVVEVLASDEVRSAAQTLGQQFGQSIAGQIDFLKIKVTEFLADTENKLVAMGVDPRVAGMAGIFERLLTGTTKWQDAVKEVKGNWESLVGAVSHEGYVPIPQREPAQQARLAMATGGYGYAPPPKPYGPLLGGLYGGYNPVAQGYITPPVYPKSVNPPWTPIQGAAMFGGFGGGTQFGSWGSFQGMNVPPIINIQNADFGAMGNALVSQFGGYGGIGGPAKAPTIEDTRGDLSKVISMVDNFFKGYERLEAGTIQQGIATLFSIPPERSQETATTIANLGNSVQMIIKEWNAGMAQGGILGAIKGGIGALKEQGPAMWQEIQPILAGLWDTVWNKTIIQKGVNPVKDFLTSSFKEGMSALGNLWNTGTAGGEMKYGGLSEVMRQQFGLQEQNDPLKNQAMAFGKQLIDWIGGAIKAGFDFTAWILEQIQAVTKNEELMGLIDQLGQTVGGAIIKGMKAAFPDGWLKSLILGETDMGALFHENTPEQQAKNAEALRRRRGLIDLGAGEEGGAPQKPSGINLPMIPEGFGQQTGDAWLSAITGMEQSSAQAITTSAATNDWGAITQIGKPDFWTDVGTALFGVATAGRDLVLNEINGWSAAWQTEPGDWSSLWQVIKDTMSNKFKILLGGLQAQASALSASAGSAGGGGSNPSDPGGWHALGLQTVVAGRTYLGAAGWAGEEGPEIITIQPQNPGLMGGMGMPGYERPPVTVHVHVYGGGDGVEGAARRGTHAALRARGLA